MWLYSNAATTPVHRDDSAQHHLNPSGRHIASLPLLAAAARRHRITSCCVLVMLDSDGQPGCAYELVTYLRVLTSPRNHTLGMHIELLLSPSTRTQSRTTTSPLSLVAQPKNHQEPPTTKAASAPRRITPCPPRLPCILLCRDAVSSSRFPNKADTSMETHSQQHSNDYAAPPSLASVL